MQKTALLIIDVQNGMFLENYSVYKGEEQLRNLQSLIKKARLADVPVVYVQHNESEGLVNGTYDWEIHPAISPEEGDLIIQKHTPDSFHETTLHDELKVKGIQDLIITGNQTEICIDTTCRRAFSLGYHVTLVKDAHGTWDSDLLSAQQIIDHHNQLLGMAFADLKATKEIEFSN